MAKKPASQITRLIVESFIKRSSMEGRSREAILKRELWRRGAAYWADASQINILRLKASARRFAMNGQRTVDVRG